MKLECEFCYQFNGYSCRVNSAVITEPYTVIKEIQGDNKAGKSNRDVQRIRFRLCVVHFIPRGLTVFFPNVTRLDISYCGLKSICRDDFKQFRKLEWLNLDGNELTTLPDDLFYDTTKLTSIWFEGNKIESMSSKLFDPIINNKFKFIYFKNNVKINAFFEPRYEGSVASVSTLMAIIDSQCFKPEHTALPKTTKSRTLLEASEIHHQVLTRTFEDLFDSGKFSDFVITVNDSKQFRVHKLILAAQCKGFTELFEEDPETTEMKIEDLIPEAVEKFLRFLYTGKLENFSGNSLEIFALVAKYKAYDLKDSIEKYIIDHINDFDAFKIFSLAHSFNSDKLKHAAFKKIQKIVPEKKLPEKLIDDLEKVKEIIETWKKFEALVNKGGKLSL